MSLYLDTTGNSSVGIAICGRCSQKFPIVELSPDPNSPGLMVCADDLDMIDPYRLPPRETEDITLLYPRPDVRLPLPGYVSVAPGDANWPPSQFPDNGLGAGQKPTTGVIPFIPGQPVIPTTGEVP